MASITGEPTLVLKIPLASPESKALIDFVIELFALLDTKACKGNVYRLSLDVT